MNIIMLATATYNDVAKYLAIANQKERSPQAITDAKTYRQFSFLSRTKQWIKQSPEREPPARLTLSSQESANVSLVFFFFPHCTPPSVTR